MSKTKKSMKKFNVKQENSKADNTEEVIFIKAIKVDVGNDSLQHSYDSRVSGHSTPIRKKDYAADIEDSPELDYHYSPISLPCTQDGGNEIAWDWQPSVNKTSNDKPKSSTNISETPKRTKQLQKKRNSNSPLLQKPYKRKQVKIENAENIGRLAAELKALSEKMKSIQQNCDHHTVEDEDDINYESDSKLMVELDNDSSDDMMAEVIVNNDKLKIGSALINNNDQQHSDYEDLFDDSIEDSMVKCSQEIEKKLNLNKDNRNNVMGLSRINEMKELSSISEKSNEKLIEKSTEKSVESSKSSRNSNISKISSTNTSGHLKTYSNNSSKRNSNSSATNSKLFNNNVTSVSDGKQTSQSSDFPDDSFDDCLATCVEDDKLLSKLSEYDFSPSSSGYNTSHCKRTPKQSVSNTRSNKKASNSFLSKLIAHDDNSNTYKSSKLITDDLFEEVEVIGDKEIIQKSFPSKSALENRKFFKTKCLSDNFCYQSTNVNTCIKGTSALKPSSVNPSVSTTIPIVRDQNPFKSNNSPSINGMENVHTLNRVGEVKSGNCIVKYKSTGNLSGTREAKESQPVQCTPEEIERKRLEAKMRLEAKRKLQLTNTKLASSGVPMNKSVKR